MTRYLKGICTGFLVYAIFQNAAAAEINGWADCVQTAKKQNPNFLAADAELQQTREDLAIAYSKWYPQADLSASVRTSSGSESYSTGISVRQLIFDGFKTPAAIGKAQAQLETAESRFAITSAFIRYQLKEAFIGLLKNSELLKLTGVIAKRRKQNVDLVKLRYAAGREHVGSRLSAEADLAQAEFEVKQARRNHKLAEQKLVKVIGIPDTPIKVAGSFAVEQDISQAPDIPALMLNTPEVKESQAATEAVRWSVQAAYAELYPSIYLSASAGLEDNHFFPEETNVSGGVSLSLPLFAGGAKMAAISKTRYALQQAENNAQSQKDSVQFNLEQKWTALQNAAGQIRVQQMYLQAAQARAKITNAQYSSGLVEFDDWAIIEDRLVTAQKSYLNSQAEQLLAEAQWIQTKGEGLEHE